MIPRVLFSAEHDDFRTSVRRFYAQEVMPHHQRWEEQQYVDRDIWRRAGELGLLCMTMPEEYGGAGADRRYSVILFEEQARAGASGVGFFLHSDIVANYILNFGTADQKARWLPSMARGETVTAIAMSEPGIGSDLQNMKTRAIDGGDHYIVNGAKTFITNGWLSDLVVVAVKTDAAEQDRGARSMTLLLVETDRPGFSKGPPLKKLGMKAQDTCELFFRDVRVPKANVLGEVGQGFVALMKELPWERMIIAISAIAGASVVLEQTLEYVRQRKVFGQSLASLQNTRFRCAELMSEIAIGQTFVDRCIELVLAGTLSAEAAAAAKYWSTELQSRAADQCLQLHGGYGYMIEYPIARAYADSRAARIYGGSNEIMKELIARTLW